MFAIELYFLSLRRFIFACFNLYFWPVFCNKIYFRLWKLFNFQRFLYICSRKVSFFYVKPDTTKITWEAQFSDLEAPLFVNPTRCLPFRLYQSLISSDCVIARRSSESFINFGLPRTVNEYIFHSNFHETETPREKINPLIYSWSENESKEIFATSRSLRRCERNTTKNNFITSLRRR